MENKCFMDGCPGIAKFTCSCDNSLNICQEHIAVHIHGTSYHDISTIRNPQNCTYQRTYEAISSLSSFNCKVLSEGKDMLREDCEKLCSIVDNLSKRQRKLVELSTHSYSDKIEKEIQELEKMNIAFRSKSDFKNFLDRCLSTENQTIDNLSLEEFKSDLKSIVKGLDKSNEAIQILASSRNIEHLLLKNLDKKVEKLEKNHQKFENFDQRLQIVELEVRKNLNYIESLSKELRKTNSSSVASYKQLNEKLKEMFHKGIQQVNEFRAQEKEIKKNIKDSTETVQIKHKNLEDKICKIEHLENSEFKELMIKNFFDEVYGRIHDLEREIETRKREKEAKIDPEKRKVDAMSLRERIEYYHPMLQAENFGNLDNCINQVKELILSTDKKFLFACIIYKDCKLNKGTKN